VLPAPLVAAVVESSTSLQVSGHGGIRQRKERPVADLGVLRGFCWAEKGK